MLCGRGAKKTFSFKKTIGIFAVMKKLPISIQTFEDIITGEMIYVDKTPFIWELVQKGKYYFLSRPRRFGKSLLISTLKSYFEGRKDLFQGLFIYEQEKQWKKYPVIHIDYSLVEYKKGREIFEQSLLEHLNNIAFHFGFKLSTSIIANAFTELAKTISEKYGPLVVLVDEYDKPMVDTLTQENRFEENREVLRGLYGTMKGLDQYFRFVMLTGVSRFAKVNIFSGMNNLHDISQNKAFAAILGFTQTELEQYFAEWLAELNKKAFQVSPDELMEQIKFMYNGFSFDGNTKLYNPFSILSLFSNLEFDNYWFSSGTPTFLIDLIKEKKQLPENFENIQLVDLTGNTDEVGNFPVYPLLYQTGYLTIIQVEYEGFNKRYHLGYPNEEVRQSFIRHIVAAFTGRSQFEIQPEALRLRDALVEGRTEDFLQSLQSFLADIPSRLHIPREAYFHSLVYMMLRLVGMRLILEKETDKGRIDAVLDLPDKTYIMEFKFSTNKRLKNVKTLSKQALAQIEKNRYHEPYMTGRKKVILFGMGYLEKQLDGKVKVV